MDLRKVKRGWMYLRIGTGTYLNFALTAFNTSVIAYRFVIEYVPVLKLVFPHLTIFIAYFLAVYIPAAIYLGYQHRKRQMPTDTEITVLANPYRDKIIPGKEEKVFIPAYKVWMEVARVLADPSGRKRIERILKEIEELEERSKT